jgi:hypothetical protein
LTILNPWGIVPDGPLPEVVPISWMISRASQLAFLAYLVCQTSEYFCILLGILKVTAQSMGNSPWKLNKGWYTQQMGYEVKTWNRNTILKDSICEIYAILLKYYIICYNLPGPRRARMHIVICSVKIHDLVHSATNFRTRCIRGLFLVCT